VAADRIAELLVFAGFCASFVPWFCPAYIPGGVSVGGSVRAIFRPSIRAVWPPPHVRQSKGRQLFKGGGRIVELQLLLSSLFIEMRLKFGA
jgi:hypothetical protein